MHAKYKRIFEKRIFYLLLLIALVIVSSLTKGRTANITSILTGILMIYGAAYFIYYIIKSPVKRNKDEM